MLINLRHPQTNKILFSHRELASPDTNDVVLAAGFADALVALRVAFGRAMNVNSCCRSRHHNNRIGGHHSSLHIYDEIIHGGTGTMAIDIRRRDGPYAWRLTRIAQDLGWSVGVAKSFLHLDRRGQRGLPLSVFGY